MIKQIIFRIIIIIFKDSFCFPPYFILTSVIQPYITYTIVKHFHIHYDKWFIFFLGCLHCEGIIDIESLESASTESFSTSVKSVHTTWISYSLWLTKWLRVSALLTTFNLKDAPFIDASFRPGSTKSSAKYWSFMYHLLSRLNTLDDDLQPCRE